MRYHDSVTGTRLFEDMVRACDAHTFPALAFEAVNDVAAVVEHRVQLIRIRPNTHIGWGELDSGEN